MDVATAKVEPLHQGLETNPSKEKAAAVHKQKLLS
jgi:hypothetical protein